MDLATVEDASAQLARAIIDHAPEGWRRIVWEGANVAESGEPSVFEQIPEYIDDQSEYQWFDTGPAPLRSFAHLYDAYRELNSTPFKRATITISRDDSTPEEVSYSIEYEYELDDFLSRLE